MFTLKNKNKEICKEKFELMYVQVKDVSKVSKLEKKISRSLSPEISMLRRSLKVNLFFKSRILRAGSLFFSKIWGLVLYTTVLYRTILRVSSYIWKLKDREIPRVVNWSIKARGHPFSSGGRSCDLCLTEKLVILTADQNSMLNKRDELREACRHRRKHLLVSLFKPPSKNEPPDTTIK